MTPTFLRWMGTPADVLKNSVLYFRIYFLGSIAFVLYNIFVGILQSVGDSRHPLIYLIISSVTNVVLDLLFIGVFRFGVGSAAVATILSQFLSAILCLIHLMRCKEDYQIHLKKIRFDFPMLKLIISNGLPSGFQNSIISFANVIVQSNIKLLWKNGSCRLRCLLKDRGIWLPADHMLCTVSDYLYQPEPRRQTVRTCKKRRKIRCALFHYYGRDCRNHYLLYRSIPCCSI